MKRKLRPVFVLFIFLSIVVTSVQSENIITKNSPSFINRATIYVDDDNINGPWDGTQEHPFRHIQDGINLSEDGDTVFVYNGTYNETLIINQSITLTGEEKIILDGLYNDILVNVLSDNVTIQNFTIRNSGGYTGNVAITLQSDNILIKNCIIYRTRIGIYAYNSSFNIINNCTLHNNEEGIHLSSSDNNVIDGCTLARNSIGIHLENSCGNRITYSYLFANGRACFFNGSKDLEIIHCNISDNSANHGGVFIRECSNIDINNCILRHNGIGVSIAESDSISVLNSTLCLNTLYAVWMDQSCSDVTVKGCEIRDNLRFGVYKPSDSRCDVSGNNIYGNMLYGMYAKQSHCLSQHNYWGSPFGPSYTDFGSGDRITFSLCRIHYRPWRLIPYEDIGADWRYNEEFMDKPCDDLIKNQITFNENDSDDDGVPDWWEEKWGYNPNSWDNHSFLDPDNDGLTNVEECYTDSYGSNPFQQDIFLEIDWVATQTDTSNRPAEEMIQEAVQVFEQHNIHLHVDVGGLEGGEEILYVSNFSFSELNELYWDYFLHNDLNNPRKGIFHYGIICDFGPDVNFPFIGWNHLDSFLISAEMLKQKKPFMNRDRLVMGGAIHHLGHTLGLLADTYGGIDNLGTLMPFCIQWLKYYNYKSCMNYYYKFKTFSYSDGTHGFGDFDDWEHLDFSFFKDSRFEWQK